MNVAVLIPTIRGREKFLRQAKSLLLEQTLSPKFIEIVDDEPIFNNVDVAWRYKIGIQRCFEKGANVVIFWEDDDWYKYNYIEFMIKQWELNKRPDLFGLNKTIYYNIRSRRYCILNHPNRASMMSTLITRNIFPDWNDDRSPYIDLLLWRKQNCTKLSIDAPSPVNIGIKHGIGIVAGGGHKWGDDKLNITDDNLTFLSSIIDKDSLNFYKSFYAKK